MCLMGGEMIRKTTIKKAATKPATKQGSAVAASPSKSTTGLSDKKRRNMIAEAAYYRAEAYQFETEEMDDWLWAESKIAHQLNTITDDERAR